MKLLFLYTEPAEYLISCLEVLAARGVEVHLVRWPLNAEAPFKFSFSPAIRVYERKAYSPASLVRLVQSIAPDAICCSGWRDKGYLSVCKAFKGKIPVVVSFDNSWTGSVRQQLASLFSGQFIHRYFSHCWIPGQPQLEFAQRLGFKERGILKGFYSCDHGRFSGYHREFRGLKKRSFPHRFIYSGRYHDFKGVEELWKAFSEVKYETNTDWQLWCLGTGSIPPAQADGIKHFGFVQPGDMGKYIADTGVFILPSRFEPWGVAVHEFAAAGFPLLCSDKVGAASQFLNDGVNGFVFRPGNVAEIKLILQKVISMSDDDLFKMGERSAELSNQITPNSWADTVLSVLK